jgi:cobalt-zinc-cadmium efflux system protein
VTHDHDHRDTDRRALTIALVLVLATMGAELAGGIVAGSLALLADVGHMLTDAAALALAVFAAAMAARPARGFWTFGFRRLEIMAALANGVLLAAVAIWIVIEAVRRLISPQEVRGGLVLAVALGGVAANLAATAVLARANRENLNVRGAFLHIASDVAAFAGTALAGGLVLATGWDRFDPIASLCVAALMLWAAVSLARDSGRILLEVSPAEIDPDEVARAIASVPRVVETHDVHVWTVTSGFPALSAHVTVEPGADCHALRRELEVMLRQRFGLDHTTLQVDHVTKADAPLVKLTPWPR